MPAPMPPHVSPALQHLRSWVKLAALVLGVAVFAQMLVFGFVHFTEIRFVEHAPKHTSRSLQVVLPQDKNAVKPIVTASTPVVAATTDIAQPRELAAADGVLEGVASMSASMGLVAAFALPFVTGLGAVIVAGGMIPGVGFTVRSAGWAVVMAAICVPWAQLLGGNVIPGIMTTYPAIVSLSDAAKAGGHSEIGLVLQFVAAPLAAIIMAGMIARWFCIGVEAGIIVTSVSELDHRVEAELEAIRAGGGSVAGRGTIRAVGALNRAIGDSTSMTPGKPMVSDESSSSKVRKGDDDMDGLSPSLLRGRSRRASITDDSEGMSRPI